MEPISDLVSTDWLGARLDNPTVRAADVRWSLVEQGKGRRSYLEGHIPGAAFFDIDTDLASPRGEGPGRHPLPTPERFAAAMSRAGIGPSTHVVAYDFGDGSTAARLWWLLRHFGHDAISLLDGGIARWITEGRALEAGEVDRAPSLFVARPRAGMMVDAAEVDSLRRDARVVIVDSRLGPRYEGVTEPVDPVAGHIPGARNRPYPANVRSSEDPRFRSPEELRQEWERLGAGRAGRVVCYCGSGVNACQNLFALRLAGLGDGLLYEGSWSDWCSERARPVATGIEP